MVDSFGDRCSASRTTVLRLFASSERCSITAAGDDFTIGCSVIHAVRGGGASEEQRCSSIVVFSSVDKEL